MKEKTTGFIGGKFLPVHLGHVYAIISAANQVDELYIILSSSKKRDKKLCERDGIRYMPAETRLSWLGELLSNMENVKIIHVEDDYWDEDYDWAEGAEMIKKAIGKKIDCVFSSETDYGRYFRKFYPDSKHVVIDAGRKIVNISATEMRKSIYKNWDKLPNCVKAYFTKKVAIVGTESCGKSTLAKNLAKFFNTNFVQEVGREYCERYSNRLTRDMFDRIAMEHFVLQAEKIKESNRVIFADSDAVITQYYLGMYFNGERSNLIEEIIRLQDYDLVIFLEPDVAWVDDGLRFAGEEETRRTNNEKLKKMYADRGIRFASVGGSFSERFDRARELVDNLFREGRA